MRFIEISFNDGGKSLVNLSSVAVVLKSSNAEGALIKLTNKEWIVCDEEYDVVAAKIMEALAIEEVEE